MWFRVLGPVEAGAGERAAGVGGPRQRALLAALLLRANTFVSVSQLCQDVWDIIPAAAESNVRTYVARLRALLRDPGEADSRLVSRRRGYVLETRPGELDLAAFEDFAARGRRALDDGDAPLAGRLLGQARALWRGEPFHGLDGPLLRAERARLGELHLTVVERHLRARIEVGEDVVGELRALVDERPTREELPALLMLALYRAGRQAEALDVFTGARERLVREVGIEPGTALRTMQQRILAADPALDPAPDPGAPPVAYRQLPMDIADFTGREAELSQLYQRIEQASGAVVITAVAGMAGVGKTRLAIHAAHELVRRGRFDEIQLWADLRGFDPGSPPADPSGVLAGFLGLLGVRQVPADLAGRAALYRDRLAGRRALVLLDNAAGEEQVRPLLPGGPGCLVLVTSRHTLSDLDGAMAVPLDVLSEPDAVAVLERIAGERVAAEPVAAARVATLCGRLPIALTLAAQRLRHRPVWTVRDLAGRLEAAADRLGELHGRSRAVRAAFDLSYRMLTDDARRVFRLAGLHPGDEFDARSVAPLAGLPPRRAAELLEELVDEHLLQEVTPGRYRPHDLLRLYARERAQAEEPDAGAAVRRLARWYLHTAETAARVLDPDRREVALDPAERPDHVPEFAGRDDALAWCEVEREALVAVVRAAAELGDDVVAWQLPCALLGFFYLRKYWDDWVTTHRTALDAVAEPGGRARVLNGLGVAYSDLCRFDEAIACHTEARPLFAGAGDVLGEAWNLNNLGVARHDVRHFDEATRCYADALPLFRAAGNRHGESIALNNLGDAHRMLGRAGDALGCLCDALAIQEETGDRAAQRFTYWAFGDLHRDAGRPGTAVANYRHALEISRELRDRRGVAKLLARIGDVHDAEGRAAQARACRVEAHAIYAALADPEADALAALLDAAPVGS
ncbi:MAG TPA: BTAD domain-containing putative transcriptional regulator [Actinophytocola sp.]|nr:BTAD domain-containing putative transcriptional regulator [Actinophytocola sp.]